MPAGNTCMFSSINHAAFSPTHYRSPLIIAFDPAFNNRRRYALEHNHPRSRFSPRKKRIKERRWLVDERRNIARWNVQRARSFEMSGRGSGAQTLGGVELRSPTRINIYLNSRWRWWRLTIPRGLFSNNPDYSWIFDGEFVGSLVFRDCPLSAWLPFRFDSILLR